MIHQSRVRFMLVLKYFITYLNFITIKKNACMGCDFLKNIGTSLKGYYFMHCLLNKRIR